MDRKKELETLLVKEFKDVEHVKSFVKEWRALGIDVSDINIINILLDNQILLLTMVSYYNFGVSSKFLELTNTIKGINK